MSVCVSGSVTVILPSLISIYAFSIFPLVSSTVMFYSVLVSSVSSLPSPSVSLPGIVSEMSVFQSLSVTPSFDGGRMITPSLSVIPVKDFVSVPSITNSEVTTVIPLTTVLSAFLLTDIVILFA